MDPNAILRPVGSVNPRFTQDGFVDSYWQQVQEQHQQGRPMYTQEELRYYRNAHPIARAIGEGDRHASGSQAQAATVSHSFGPRPKQHPSAKKRLASLTTRNLARVVPVRRASLWKTRAHRPEEERCKKGRLNKESKAS